jgi:cytochrome c biogenesis protein CcmG/thiol:disulfide interchange protein DsbE
MLRRLRLLGGTLVIAMVITAVAIFGLASHPASGRPAPALPRESLAGAPVTLASLLAGARGRAALVVFWASWCGPCAEEAPALERFSESPIGRGRIVGVDWSDALTGARAFVRRYAWSFPNVRDAEGTVGYAYGLTGLPTTFVLDHHGRIRAALRGPQSESSLERALVTAEHS